MYSRLFMHGSMPFVSLNSVHRDRREAYVYSTTVERPQEMLLDASRRCRSTMTGVYVHSSWVFSLRYIFESQQLIIRHWRYKINTRNVMQSWYIHSPQHSAFIFHCFEYRRDNSRSYFILERGESSKCHMHVGIKYNTL